MRNAKRRNNGLPPAIDTFHSNNPGGTQDILTFQGEKDFVIGGWRTHPYTETSFCSARSAPHTLGTLAEDRMTAEYYAGPVPLYLIPQALSTEIRRVGDSITEIRIRRTSGHNYRLRICHDEKEGSGDE